MLEILDLLPSPNPEIEEYLQPHQRHQDERRQGKGTVWLQIDLQKDHGVQKETAYHVPVS